MSSIGAIYRDNSSWQGARWSELMDMFAKQRIDTSFLKLGIDLGCGTGQRTIDFISRVPSVEKIYAIDANPSMIETANKINSSDKIQYKLLNIESIDKLKLADVDFLLANYSIHWAKEKENIFDKLSRIVKSGSLLIVGTVEALPDMLQAIDDYQRNHWNIKDEYPYYFLEKNLWEKILAEFGWEILDERKKEDVHIVDSGIVFLKEWYAASTGIAFYNKGMDVFENPEIGELKLFLDSNYGINNNTQWRYLEHTYLFYSEEGMIYPSFSETVRYQIKHKMLLRITAIYLVLLVLFTLFYFISFAVRIDNETDNVMDQFVIEQKFSDSISSDLTNKATKLCNSFDCLSAFVFNSKTNELKLSYPSKTEKTSPIFLKNESSGYWFGHVAVLSVNQFLLKFSKDGFDLFIILSMNGYFRILLLFLVLFLVITGAFYLTSHGVAKEVSTLLEEEINKLMSLTKGTGNKTYPQTKEIVFLYEHILQQSKFAAIGQISAMLAHDVRKPFSMLRSMLSMFEIFKKDPKELENAKQDIEKSMKNVESMLSDIMDFSREVKLETKPVSIVNLFDFSIRQISQSYQDADIKFIYKLEHTNKPLLDDERMVRVLGNIIGNAVEAITIIGKKSSGTVAIGTADIENGFMQIIIGNDGPFFREEDIQNLFESFFTKGKKKGTGLGLASAQKIVKLHEGQITARNRVNKQGVIDGVEFVINLHSSAEREYINLDILPKTIREAMFVKLEKNESEIDGIIKELGKSNKEFTVLLLEDETLYRAGVRNTVKKNEALDKIITMYDAHTVDEALKLLQTEKITHAIVDIDLGEIKNGFDFLQEVKQKYPSLRSMVHSNRHFDDDRKKAKDLGARMFAPKPLNIEHLVLFLEGKEVGFTEMERMTVKVTSTKKILLYANDEKISRMHFEVVLSPLKDEGYEIQTFNNGEDLLSRLKELKGCTMVFTDQYMGDGIVGTELLKEINRLGLACRKFVISSMPGDDFIEEAKNAGAENVFNPTTITLELIKTLIG